MESLSPDLQQSRHDSSAPSLPVAPVSVILTSTRIGVLWGAWTLLIVMVGILPLHNFVGHSHWEFVRWIPTPDQLSSPQVLLDLAVDAVANIALFAPFGLFFTLRWLHGPAVSRRLLLLLAFALSLSIEYYQVYCHNRSTSLLDLVDNVLGAYVGMTLGEWYVRRERARPEQRIEAPTANRSDRSPAHAGNGRQNP